MGADLRWDLRPASRQHPQEMPVRDNKRVAGGRSQPGDDAIRPGDDVLQLLTARTAVAEEFPVGALRADLRGRQAVVGAVVPLLEIQEHFHPSAEAREFAS